MIITSIEKVCNLLKKDKAFLNDIVTECIEQKDILFDSYIQLIDGLKKLKRAPLEDREQIIEYLFLIRTGVIDCGIRLDNIAKALKETCEILQKKKYKNFK